MTQRPFYRIGSLVFALCCVFAALKPASAQTVSLQSLLTGGSLTVNDKVFSNFRLYTSDVVSADPADPANTTLTPLADDPLNPGILWEGGQGGTVVGGPPGFAEAGEWDVDAGGTQVTRFLFDVSTISGAKLIEDNTLSLGAAGIFEAGEVRILEVVSAPGVNLLGRKEVHLLLDDFKRDDHIDFAPQNFITVETIITLDSHTTGAAALASFSQRFSQLEVPELGALGLIGSTLVGAVLFLRQRRN